MYLEKLELQGFKTFAQKTTLEFLAPRAGKRGITGIVGPNGSGKSNIADSVRWVLGEQSLKLLRGKKSEDVIFSGTEKRARSGFAEISLTLNNEDHGAPIDYTTLVVTRRLYRDGESEYLVGGKPARLGDIQLLLAQSNIGQRTYSVIGQGMVDHVLAASPQERKEFIEEAAGVKQFQIKRNQAASKLERTRENLTQAEALLLEIEPRLRSLSRQVKRLGERGPIEEELRTLGRAYYGKLWRELREAIARATTKAKEVEGRRSKKAEELVKLRAELETMEQEETRASSFLELQKEYDVLIDDRNTLREALLKIENALERAKLVSQGGSPIAMPRVISLLEAMLVRQRAVVSQLESIRTLDELTSIRTELEALGAELSGAIQEFTRGAPREAPRALFEDEKKQRTALASLEEKIKSLQARLKNFAAEERDKKGRFFVIQREWEARSAELSIIDREASDFKVELAKYETRQEALRGEIEREMKLKVEEALEGDEPPLTIEPAGTLERLGKLKTQLEMIGGIDPEVLKEHEETKTRYDFLKIQTGDLQKAAADLLGGIAELDQITRERTEAAFKTINQEFGRYFKLLFGGGHALLTKTEVAMEEEETEATLERQSDGAMEKKAKKNEYTGIEIQATPPGKRVKAINMLSGGERALTSIALICAIMASNPSPFVVLDEVDAALDESNSIRFAEILDDLSTHTQFVVITHNRATMHKANILYGVTIGDEGVSRLLSLKLEEAEAIRGESKVTV